MINRRCYVFHCRSHRFHVLFIANSSWSVRTISFTWRTINFSEFFRFLWHFRKLRTCFQGVQSPTSHLFHLLRSYFSPQWKCRSFLSELSLSTQLFTQTVFNCFQCWHNVSQIVNTTSSKRPEESTTCTVVAVRESKNGSCKMLKVRCSSKMIA